MRTLTLLTVVAAALGSQARAQDLRPEQALAAQQFADIDANKDGRLTAEEFTAYGDLVFTSMDSDESQTLGEGEFLDWGFGMHNLADEAGVRQGYDTAIRVVFDLWDRDNDRAVGLDEQRDAHRMAFGFADADGSLGEAEFADNFISTSRCERRWPTRRDGGAGRTGIRPGGRAPFPVNAQRCNNARRWAVACHAGGSHGTGMAPSGKPKGVLPPLMPSGCGPLDPPSRRGRRRADQRPTRHEHGLDRLGCWAIPLSTSPGIGTAAAVRRLMGRGPRSRRTS